MAAVGAARWDVEWDRGGGWWVRLGRRTRSADVLPLAAPCSMEVRHVDEPSTAAAALILPGELGTGGAYFDLQATRTQIEALPLSRYEHRILVTDAVRGLPLVLLYGYVDLNDTVGDR